MNLLKTSFLGAFSAGIGMVCLFISGKAFAIFVGPAGFSVVGQLMYFTQIMLLIAGGLYQMGVVKYVAEHKGNPDFLRDFYRTTTTLALGSIVILFVFLLVFAHWLSLWVFKTPGYENLFRVFAFTIIFFSANNFLLRILNGLGEIKSYTLANIASGVFSMILTVFLLYFMGLRGGLYAMILGQAGVFFYTAYLLARTKKFKWDYLGFGFDKLKAMMLGKFALMSIVAGIAAPVSQMILLNFYMSKLGPVDVGYWQAMNRIVSIVSSVFMSGLSLYYIPVLSALYDKAEIRKEIFKVYRLIIPLLVLACFITWLLRKPLICFALTKQFLPMEQLFFYQLLALIFQMLSWIICNLMWAKSMYRVFIISEIVFVSTYVLLGVFCVNHFGFEGVSIAPCINYGLYLIFSFLLLAIYLKE